MLSIFVFFTLLFQSPSGTPSVVILRDGGPPTGVDVVALVNGEKVKDLGPALKAIAAKFAKETRVDVYKRMCEGDRIELLMIPAGELVGTDDKDCLKNKEPAPGATCFCKWIGGFALGDPVTIDAETGRVSGTRPAASPSNP